MNSCQHLSRPISARDKCWQREFVAEWGLLPQPRFVAVVGTQIGSLDLGDFLVAHPGSHILKPRYGSNGVAVVRVVSDGQQLQASSDCPDTALFLDEFPANPQLHGRDVIAATITHRSRFMNRATAGLPDWAMELSILEDEIRQDRADGALFEPRVVAQRIDSERFATLGAICKCVETPIGAVVARDFRELSLEEALSVFLQRRVPQADLLDTVRRIHAQILSVGDQLAMAVAPLAGMLGVRVHQFGVDGRLCWNEAANEAEFWFLEFQFGIGRIDSSQPPGYRTPAELREQFGPEIG